MMIPGSATLVRTLLDAGLADQLRLLLFPLVLGSGDRLFDGLDHRLPMQLTESRTLSNGVLALVYEPESSSEMIPDDLALPARRALIRAGYTRLDHLTMAREGELLQLHGVGRAAITQLRDALAAVGKSFAP